MIENSKTIAVLDACVLYSAPLRDILLNLAEQDIYDPKWSEIITNEWFTNLLKNRPDLKEENLRRTIGFMEKKFKYANITNFDHELEKFNMTAQHPDDFICDLIEMDKKTAVDALNAQLKMLKNPPVTKEELLETFKRNGLPKAAELFK